MEKIKSFIAEYLKIEFEYTLGIWCEKDNGLFDIKKQELYKFYTHGIIPINERPLPLPDGWLEKCGQQKQFICEREVFEIRRLDHRELGTLYQCFLSEGKTYSQKILDTILIIQPTEKNMKIITRYFVSAPEDIFDKKNALKIENLTLEYAGGFSLSGLGVTKEKEVFEDYELSY